MANALRGEVDYTVFNEDGTERRYTLRLTTNAICEMQTKLSKTYGEIVQSLASVDMISLRELLFMSLRKYHGDEIKTADQAGDLIDAAGGPSTVVDAITELFLLNQPKDAKTQAVTKGRAAGPRKAAG